MNNHHSPEYQLHVFQVKLFIKYELFKDMRIHHIIDRLIEVLVYVRGHKIKTRRELDNVTGEIERELDTAYIKSPTSLEVHYHDYLFSRCCTEIVNYFYHKEADVIETLKQLFRYGETNENY